MFHLVDLGKEDYGRFLKLALKVFQVSINFDMKKGILLLMLVYRDSKAYFILGLEIITQEL